jgi:hypothetical protein
LVAAAWAAVRPTAMQADARRDFIISVINSLFLLSGKLEGDFVAGVSDIPHEKGRS